MTDRPRSTERKPSRVRTGRVKHVERLTPQMIRVVFNGPDLVDLPFGEFTDAYVKLVFPPDAAPYHSAEEFAAMRPDLAPEHRPALRTYTIRAYDEQTGELTLDFVYHGDEGVAGPWAAAAEPGDELMMLGPGGGYVPDPTADWHLLIGDESALPAIAAAAENVPPGVPVFAYVEVSNADEEQPLDSPGRLEVTWVHRDRVGGKRGDGLVAAVQAAVLPDGDGQAFLHGEAGFVRVLRHHLRMDRGMARDRLSVSGYWRHGRTDEGWRAEKKDWKRDVEADERQLAG